MKDGGFVFGTRIFIVLSMLWAISIPFGVRGPFDDGVLPVVALAFGGIVGAAILRYCDDPAGAPGLSKVLAMVIVSGCQAVAGWEVMAFFPVIVAVLAALQLLRSKAERPIASSERADAVT
ncbi:MAG: hypothetical protein INF91_10375 [Alphaproteobacteria bacterium]|nr:hypothetical protein [Alphaproteobacteria bacterium]